MRFIDDRHTLADSTMHGVGLHTTSLVMVISYHLGIINERMFCLILYDVLRVCIDSLQLLGNQMYNL